MFAACLFINTEIGSESRVLEALGPWKAGRAEKESERRKVVVVLLQEAGVLSSPLSLVSVQSLGKPLM
jgi:hypothetical protein